MCMKKTEKGTKKFTEQEKLSIIKEVKENGLKATMAKYAIYSATYYYWKRKYEVHGSSGLSHQTKKEREKRIQRLEKENESRKKLLAESHLEHALKNELLKKKYPELRNQKW